MWSFKEVDALLVTRSREPESWLFAAVQGWRYPVSREWMLLADLFDLTGRAHGGKKFKSSYPRPWKNAAEVKTGTVRADARVLLSAAREGRLSFSR